MGDVIMTNTITGSKTPHRRVRRQRMVHLGFDVQLVLISFILIVFGLLMVYSASWDFSLEEYGSPTYMFERQLIWLSIGTVALLVATFLDYHYLRRFAVIALIGTIVSLIFVWFANEVRLGSARSISGGSIMPSEAAKLVMIIYLSIWLYSKRNYLSDIKLGLVPLSCMIGLISVLIMLQPDISAAATILFIGVIMFFLAGGALRQIAILLIGIVIVGWLVITISPTGASRLEPFLLGLKDPNQYSYHVQRSLEAFNKGGWFGVGIGEAETKLLWLPVPPTDSIFAVVGEETGVFGSVMLLLLYGFLGWRGLSIARNAPDMLGTLLASGISMWLVMESFVNMAVMVGLLPFAGNALPFISYGGSNLVVSMVAIGILINISRISKQEDKKEKERKLDEVVGLRRSQRRRRVSRPRRTARAR
jgi:cell division protein FtsW